ncbi:MAG: UDP-N-acetylmuramate dehydrogenase [Myxococcales bacterium]|nr:UDP-N-acetylmuramate dehydrogenase [Myxococcales bacterium]MBL0196653.1 UDP-N-acetylmuramate dehydrogenase [Myxococcales bacterium]HQY62267.1 UDP-N-acetylmuramate dehydrogenase [Polyangiaceae bacterium]
MRVVPAPPLSHYTTLRLGGPPDAFVEAADEVSLVDCLALPGPVTLLGGGSNLVVADAGVAGTVVHVKTRGVRVDLDGASARLTAAAGEVWDDLVALTVERGLAGLECLSGIPGLVGAVPIQNVGAYGQDVSATIAQVRVFDRVNKCIMHMPPVECGFGYRTSVFRGAARYAVLEVSFALAVAEDAPVPPYAELRAALGLGAPDGGSAPRAGLRTLRDTVLRLRRAKGMVVSADDPDSVSAGSFFTNPELTAADLEAARARVRARCGDGARLPEFPGTGGLTKVSAAWLIERAGFPRGFGAGRVGLSAKHTLALVNRGGATTTQLLALAREVRDGVSSTFGVTLAPEPVLLGVSW